MPQGSGLGAGFPTKREEGGNPWTTKSRHALEYERENLVALKLQIPTCPRSQAGQAAPHGSAHLEGTLKLIAHPSELAAVALRGPEIGGSRTRAAPKGAELLSHPFILLGPRGVRTVPTPGLQSPSACGSQGMKGVNLDLLLSAPQSPFNSPSPSFVYGGSSEGICEKSS